MRVHINIRFRLVNAMFSRVDNVFRYVDSMFRQTKNSNNIVNILLEIYYNVFYLFFVTGKSFE